MRRILMAFVYMPMMVMATSYYVNGMIGWDGNSGTSESSPKATIQGAIDAAAEGDAILVAPGTYAPIATGNKALTIVSTGGRDQTVIDGGGSQRCAFLGTSTNECATVLSGFTLENGYLYISWGGQGGAGARGGTLVDCVVTNCRIDGGWSGYGGEGGGVSDSVVRRCVITSCSALAGGGVSYSQVESSTIMNCYARDDSGGAHYCELHNCLIASNYGYNTGGGACGSAMAGSRAYNCTIANNDARSGGTINSGSLYNCIVYGNTPVNIEDGWNAYEDSCKMFSCVTDNPCFVDAANGDYRLVVDSPCVDAGDNAYVTTDRDLAGNIRIANGRVDIGCYEYGASGDSLLDGLVAWYKFDGNADDSSGNGNHGVVHGATLTADRHGNANSAYKFSGYYAGEYISVANSESLYEISRTVSISAWIRPDGWEYPDGWNTSEPWLSIVCKGGVDATV